MKRMIWTVVHRDAVDTPQQETIRYTEEAADKMAGQIIADGGVAIVIEGDEDIPDYDNLCITQATRSGLIW